MERLRASRCANCSHHLESCDRCSRHYVSLRQTQHLLARVGRRKAPPDLALKLRVAISQEAAQSRRRYLDGVRVRLENALDLFMVPATAGLAAAVVIFVVLMGFLAPLQADNSDVPLMLHTAPQLQQSAFGSTLDSINDDSLVIEAYVDSQGRVQDYRILSDSKEDKLVAAAGQEEHAHLHHLHHLPSRAFHGQADDRAGDTVVLASQREGVALAGSRSARRANSVPNKKLQQRPLILRRTPLTLDQIVARIPASLQEVSLSS